MCCQVGGASHSGSAEFSHHPGGPVPGDRGSSWIPGLSEPTHLPGPPPVATPSQAGPTSHPSQPPSVSSHFIVTLSFYRIDLRWTEFHFSDLCYFLIILFFKISSAVSGDGEGVASTGD